MFRTSFLSVSNVLAMVRRLRRSGVQVNSVQQQVNVAG
jgi:biotin operon repressor